MPNENVPRYFISRVNNLPYVQRKRRRQGCSPSFVVFAAPVAVLILSFVYQTLAGMEGMLALNKTDITKQQFLTTSTSFVANRAVRNVPDSGNLVVLPHCYIADNILEIGVDDNTVTQD